LFTDLVAVTTGLSSGWPHVVQGPKFKILICRSCVHGIPVEYMCRVLSKSAQQCQSFTVLKMLTPHGRSHVHLTSFIS